MKVLHQAPTLFEFAAVLLGSAAIMAVIFIAIYERDAQAITVLNTVVGAATGTFFLTRQAGQPTDDGKKGVVPPTTARPAAEIPTRP